MSSFTARDVKGLTTLVDHQKAVYRRNVLLERAPHIATHTVFKLKMCTDEYEYRDPVYVPSVDDDQHRARRDLEDLAVVADWTFTPTGCDHVVSCNPFYPKSKRCKGMPYRRDKKNNPTAVPTSGTTTTTTTKDEEGGETETAFSFRTLNGQQFDACQPVCYDPAAAPDNMVGVTSRFKFGKCRVYDPMMMAFYLDPTRRYVNPDTQILERKAFVVEDVLIEPYKDAVLLASMPDDYCDQYGGTYKSDGKEQGIGMYKCADNALVWSTSWLIGETIPKLTVLAYDKALPYLATGEDWAHEEETRHPPSRQFLTSRLLWLNNTDYTKRPLPFPLRLSDVGIVRGTVTEHMVWTDEFSHLNDGRNDAYGGRLVERARPVARGPTKKISSANIAAIIARNMSAGGRYGFTDPRTGERNEAEHRETADEARVESAMLKSLARGVHEYQQVAAEVEAKEGRGGDSFGSVAAGAGAGVAYGIGYEYLARKWNIPSTFGVLKTAFAAVQHAPSYAKKVPLKVVGFWAAKAATAGRVESAVVRTLISRFKTMALASALGPLALVIDLISLLGLAMDILLVLLHAVGVSTPVSRRENFVSDRRLYRLAQTEIEFNRRLYGSGNIELTPSRFVVNTPYAAPDEDVQSYMAVMPIVYAARSLNSDGGRLKPTNTDGHDGGGDDNFEIGKDGRVHYVKNNVRRPVDVHDEILSAADEMLSAAQRQPKENTTATVAAADQVERAVRYYVVALFIAACLIGYFYPNNNWMVAVAILFSVLSVAYPLVVNDFPGRTTTS